MSLAEVRIIALEQKLERALARLAALEALAARFSQDLQRLGTGQGQGGGGPVLYALAPGGGIAGRTGTTCASASCEIYFKDGSGVLADAGYAAPVFNLSTTAVGGGKYLAVAADSNGDLTTLVESCA